MKTDPKNDILTAANGTKKGQSLSLATPIAEAAQTATAQDEAGVATGADATLAVVFPAQATQVDATDARPSHGGLYTVKDGKRVLLERTALDVAPTV